MSNTKKITPLNLPINKTITIPGSKSFSNRALVMAALTNGTSTLKGISKCDDTVVLIKALKKLGIDIKVEKNKIKIKGNGGIFKKTKTKLNIGLAGTTSRYLASVCALVPGEIILDGVGSIKKRPINKLVNALKNIGAKIEYLEKKGCLPLKITGSDLNGGKIEMDGGISSQFFTSLLLIAPILEKGLRIKVKGKQISKSYIDMTIQSLKTHGIKVKNNNYKKYIVPKNQKYKSGVYQMEGDGTGATYFWAIAAVTGSTIEIKNIPPDSLQGDVEFINALKKMGCQVTKNKTAKTIAVTGPTKDLELKPIKINMEGMPDAAQTLAVVAAFACGVTEITGLSTLKIKETDRLVALKTELAKMKIKTTITNNSIKIYGGKPKGATIKTYNDHRMAMAFAIAGLRIPNIKIQNPKVVSKSFPEFWDIMNSL